MITQRLSLIVAALTAFVSLQAVAGNTDCCDQTKGNCTIARVGEKGNGFVEGGGGTGNGRSTQKGAELLAGGSYNGNGKSKSDGGGKGNGRSVVNLAIAGDKGNGFVEGGAGTGNGRSIVNEARGGWVGNGKSESDGGGKGHGRSSPKGAELLHGSSFNSKGNSRE